MSEELMCTEGTTKFLGPFQILDEVDEPLTKEAEENVTKSTDSHEKESESGDKTIVETESDIKKETEPISDFIQQNVQERKTASDKQSPEETITCEDKMEKKDTGEESTVIEKELGTEKAPKSENEFHNLVQDHQEEEIICEKQSLKEKISCEVETEKKGIGEENMIVEKELDVKEPPKSETEHNNLIQEKPQEERTTCEKQSPEETISRDDNTEKEGIGEENMIVGKELDIKEPPRSETEATEHNNLLQENPQEEQTTCEKKSPEETISCDDKTEKKGIGEENIVEKEAPKSETEHNNLIQENFQEEKTICKKQSPEEKKNHEDDTDLKCLHNDLPKNDSINPEETNIKKPFIEEDEKSVNSFHTEEGKEDSLSVSHDDETSIRSCQDDLTIDLCEESDVAISENVDEYDKDEENEEEPMNCHPFSFVIDTFELTKEQKIQTKIGPPKSLKETPVQMVHSRIGLLKLLPTLNSAKEIALRMQIDNNQFEPSIQLMAISTRDTDYIIDVAKVNKDLLLLTETFINPKIVKIIFGAARVLSTLQNILHLYVVNIFDCEKAAKALQTGHKSIDMILQKEYSHKLFMRQGDFRSRPLSPQYQDYCRAIPHYLIYIYHDYKNKLLSKDENLYKKLMAEFREASKIIYPQYRTTQLLSLEEELQNHHKCQLEVLEKLNEWRNDAAIKRNINPVAVIPKPHLVTLSSTLPVTEFSLGCISKSPFVKEDAEKILAIIKEARRKYNLEEKKLKSNSKKKIQDFKYLLWKELHGSNLNVNRKMSNTFEKPKFQKMGEAAAVRGRNRPGPKQKKKPGFAPKSQQNTSYKSVNNDYSPGFNYFKQAASNSYNESNIQKRGKAFKRKISSMHGQTGEDHNPRKKWK